MSIDGELRPPLTTDSLRYRYAVFQAPTSMTLQKMDLTFARFGATIDTVNRTLTLRKASDSTWKPVLTYERPTPTRLTIESALMSSYSASCCGQKPRRR